MWSAQDARSNAPHHRSANTHPRQSHWINFHNPPQDQHSEQEYSTHPHEHNGYTQFSNPMWTGSEQIRTEGDLNVPAHQGTVHDEDQHLHSTVRQTSNDASSLSKRLGLPIQRVAIPKGDIHVDRLPPWALALQKSADITKVKWGDKPKISIAMDVQEAADYTQYLLDHALVGYFTSNCPLRDDFNDWVQHEFSYLRGWKIAHVKFVGKNFYLILFDQPLHQQQALTMHPWKYNNRFVYFFKWEPEFNVSTGQYTKLPVWVEITYRDLNLEPMRIKIAEALGTVLMYSQEDEHSSFPHDRVCVLWDMNRPIPYCVEVTIGSGIAFYQPLVFKNMPFTCFKCNGHGHIAKDCKLKDPLDNPAGVGYPENSGTNVNRRGGFSQQPGRPMQYQEQQFTSTGSWRQHRVAERTQDVEEQEPQQSEERRDNSFQHTELQRFETTLNQARDTNYMAGHTPTAPSARYNGFDELQTSQKSFTPAYRTLSDQHITQQVLIPNKFRKAMEQNVVVTPLVHHPAGTSAEGGSDVIMLRDATPENSDVEMVEIDKHELARFRLWEKQGGRKQDERSPGTPSHHQKTSPANKKNRKSLGDLFPAPRDVTPNWQKKTTENEVATSNLSVPTDDHEMQVDAVDEALSDHDPTFIRVVVSSRVSDADLIRSSHFKANPAILKQPGNIEALREAWEDRSGNLETPTLRFLLGCKRLREKYKDLQEKPKERSEEIQILRENIIRLKSELEEEEAADTVSELMESTSKLKELDEAEASRWRRLSRVKWLGEGEETTKYYFKLLKAKQKREKMPSLLTAEDIVILGDKEIIEECYRFYVLLYGIESPSCDTQPAREKLWRCPRRKIDPAAKLLLEEPPSAKELLEVLLMIPLDKSPELDGLTSEVYRACWDFMKDDFLAMILGNWSAGTYH
ncbi:unnamed protein product [Calypogeia fissa]